MLLRLTNLNLRLRAQGLDAVSSVKRGSNLLIRVDETLELGVKLDVLAGEDVTMVLERVDFLTHVLVVCLHRLRGETQLVLLTLIRIQVVLGATALGLQVVQVGREFSVASQFIFGAANHL